MDDSSRQGQGDMPAVKQALVELRRLRAKLAAVENAGREKIAIVGLGLRFPGGAVDASSFWRLLSGGEDAITEIPPERWDVDAFYDPDPQTPGKMTARHGGFLHDVDRFDTEFFGISPRESVATDPQQRLLLEVAWEALENAAIAPESLRGTPTGVYLAVSNNDYGRRLIQDFERIESHAGTGCSHAVASGRISYSLGLQGPCMVVDTACSGSLVALAQACAGLRRGDCDVALAGGVNLILSPEMHIAFSKAGMLAADGRCKTFDAAADGYVRSEGCAMLVLKRLSDAVRDADPIVALVRSAAVNQDGASSGLTVPNGPAQEAVIRTALAEGDAAPGDIDYIETHGTGTSLGDPIEVHALGEIFARDRPADRRLLIGSVKTNIGHLEAAAGIAGVIKAALALQHGQIPPQLHFQAPSPQVDWQHCPFDVPTELTPWPAKDGARLAGISSFGFSGTNAHVILEQAPARETETLADEPAPRILCLSAKGDAPLRALAQRYADSIANSSTSMAEVARTAHVGRSHFSHRLVVAGDTREVFHRKLIEAAGNGRPEGCRWGSWMEHDPPDVVFLFTGQGAQYAGMGRGLYDSQPVFRKAIDRCNEILRPFLEQPLLSALYPVGNETSRLDQTAYAQPALFAIEYALSELWHSFGVRPSAVFGHSVGEYAAACVAGVLSLEDGLRLTAERGRLMQSTSQGGAMAAVFAGMSKLTDVLESCSDRISVAAVNGPENTVLSGDEEAIAEVLEVLSRNGVDHQRLEVSHAFHSPLIEPCLDDFEDVARSMSFEKPGIPIVASNSGRFVGDEMTEPNFWARQSRDPVLFWEGMETLRNEGYRMFVEIGPHPTLLGIGQSFWPAEQPAAWLPSLRRGRGDEEQIVDTVGELYVSGAEIAWSGVHGQSSRPRIALPTYPFQRERFWWEASAKLPAAAEGTGSAWETVVQAGKRQADQVPIDMHLETYGDVWARLDRLAQAYILDALQSLGAFAKGEATVSADSLIRTGGVLPTYKALVSRWLGQLAEDGLFEKAGDGFEYVTPRPEIAVERLRSEAQSALQDSPLLYAYVERCGRLLANVLTGDESPLETLFPGGSGETAEWLYRHWSMSRYLNAIAASVVSSVVREWPASKPIRLLEIGAGTGSTSLSVLPMLPADQAEYYFTDVSDYFLGNARETFRDYPFVRYGVLDIGLSPKEQGYGAHTFDVVVAANVLHATGDLGKTVRHVRSVLKPGGLLLLLEVTRPPRWYDITVGLIEGWQSFEDDLRTDNPLLSAVQWDSLLGSSGFDRVEAFPPSDSPADILGNQVIIARATSDGGPEEAVTGERLAESTEQEATGTSLQDVAAADVERVAAFLQQLRAVPVNERHELLVDFVRQRVSKVLRRDPDKTLDRRHRLMDLGIDSLMAVELRNLLGAGLGLEEPLPATLIFDFPTIDAIASEISERLLADGGPNRSSVATAGKGGAAQAVTEEDLEELTDEEVEAMLMDSMDKSRSDR